MKWAGVLARWQVLGWQGVDEQPPTCKVRERSELALAFEERETFKVARCFGVS